MNYGDVVSYSVPKLTLLEITRKKNGPSATLVSFFLLKLAFSHKTPLSFKLMNSNFFLQNILFIKKQIKYCTYLILIE